MERRGRLSSAYSGQAVCHNAVISDQHLSMAPSLPGCKLLLYPEPPRLEQDYPKWERVPIGADTDLRYGRARFVESVLLQKGGGSYVFYAWSKPDDLLDIHRELANEDVDIGEGADGAVIVAYIVGREYGRKFKRLDNVLEEGFASLAGLKGENIDSDKAAGLFYARAVLDAFAGQNAYPHCGHTLEQAKRVQKCRKFPEALKKIFENIEQGRDLGYGAVQRYVEHEVAQAEETERQKKLKPKEDSKGWPEYDRIKASLTVNTKDKKPVKVLVDWGKYEALAASMKAYDKDEKPPSPKKRKVRSKPMDDVTPLVFVQEKRARHEGDTETEKPVSDISRVATDARLKRKLKQRSKKVRRE